MRTLHNSYVSVISDSHGNHSEVVLRLEVTTIPNICSYRL